MRECLLSAVLARPSFIVTPYEPAGDGRLVPHLPLDGPCRLAGGACRLRVHHVRERSTGPCFPLTVVRCETHGRAFTLYPPGHVPYGRVALVALAPNGEAVRGAEPFAGTLFDVAKDAAQGVAWSREQPGGSDRWWGTQGRRLERAARLTGVVPGQPAELRYDLAGLLDIDVLQLVPPPAPAGYRSLGEAVCRVIDALHRGPSLVDRLGAAGALVGLWGEPLRFDPSTNVVRRQPFRATGTTGPPPRS